VDWLDEVCKYCGLTRGAHHGGEYFSKTHQRIFHFDQCPGHQGRMDWENGPGSCFAGTGQYAEIPYGTPAKDVEHVATEKESSSTRRRDGTTS
jgi:hypothetical protein